MQNNNVSLILNNSGKNSEYKLLLFDLSIYGHHSNYIQHFIKYWHEQKSQVHLDIVVSPEFMKVHADVVTATTYSQKIRYVLIATTEATALKAGNSSANRNIRAFQEWNLLHKYATLLQANKCLIIYFDTCLLPLALGIKPPCPFSGIYFRPTFHYSEFSNYLPSRKNYLQQWREKFILSSTLSNQAA